MRLYKIRHFHFYGITVGVFLMLQSTIKMKSVLVVLVTLVVLSKAMDKDLKDKILQRMQEIGTKCIEETHASDDDVAALLTRKFPPTTHEGKCMIFCMHKGFHMMTEDGNIDKEGGLREIEPLKATDPDMHEKSVKLIEICASSTEKDSDPCQTSVNYAECGIREGKAIGLSLEMFEV